MTKYKEIINFIEELERKEVAQSIIKSLEQAVSKPKVFSFNMSELETERAKTFSDYHYRVCKNPTMTYSFKGVGGIGYEVKVKCDCCGFEEDITDTGSW